MANYSSAVKVVLTHEGGYSDIPEDRGGATNFGICLKFAKDSKDYHLFDKDHDGDIDNDDIKLLTKEDAELAFKKYFWDKFQLDSLLSDKKALVVFDIAVNHGNYAAASMVQKTLVECDFDLVIDGLFGPNTFNALNSVNEQIFIMKLLDVRYRYYDKIVKKNPSQKVFINGWRNRIQSLRQILITYPN